MQWNVGGKIWGWGGDVCQKGFLSDGTFCGTSKRLQRVLLLLVYNLKLWQFVISANAPHMVQTCRCNVQTQYGQGAGEGGGGEGEGGGLGRGREGAK